ncbi:MAG: ATP-binding protein [Phycisphaerales bacterium]
MGQPHTSIPDAESVELLNDRQKITEFIESILALASQAGMKDAAIFAVRLAIEEAITNAFVHGHKNLPADLTVRVEYKIQPGDLHISIQDQGPGFVPEKLPDPTLAENLSKPFGRGVMLMNAYMTEVSYNESGNQVIMRYTAPAE